MEDQFVDTVWVNEAAFQAFQLSAAAILPLVTSITTSTSPPFLDQFNFSAVNAAALETWDLQVIADNAGVVWTGEDED